MSFSYLCSVLAVFSFEFSTCDHPMKCHENFSSKMAKHKHQQGFYLSRLAGQFSVCMPFILPPPPPPTVDLLYRTGKMPQHFLCACSSKIQPVTV